MTIFALDDDATITKVLKSLAADPKVQQKVWRSGADLDVLLAARGCSVSIDRLGRWKNSVTQSKQTESTATKQIYYHVTGPDAESPAGGAQMHKLLFVPLLRELVGRIASSEFVGNGYDDWAKVCGNAHTPLPKGSGGKAALRKQLAHLIETVRLLKRELSPRSIKELEKEEEGMGGCPIRAFVEAGKKIAAEFAAPPKPRPKRPATTALVIFFNFFFQVR